MNGTKYETSTPPMTDPNHPGRGHEIGYECMCGTAIFEGDRWPDGNYVCPECGAIHPAEDVES